MSFIAMNNKVVIAPDKDSWLLKAKLQTLFLVTLRATVFRTLPLPLMNVAFSLPCAFFAPQCLPLQSLSHSLSLLSATYFVTRLPFFWVSLWYPLRYSTYPPSQITIGSLSLVHVWVLKGLARFVCVAPCFYRICYLYFLYIQHTRKHTHTHTPAYLSAQPIRAWFQRHSFASPHKCFERAALCYNAAAPLGLAWIGTGLRGRDCLLHCLRLLAKYCAGYVRNKQWKERE